MQCAGEKLVVILNWMILKQKLEGKEGISQEVGWGSAFSRE